MLTGTETITATNKPIKPEILAPAGDLDCFLAALAAGADGIYLGLKNFSARMAATNFGLGELARLVELAHENNCRVYVAMNNLLKQRELGQAYRLVRRMCDMLPPDGLIVQDAAMVNIARQTQFPGIIAFSTLANVTDAAGLDTARRLGAQRVIVPRELSIDEMRTLGEACPDGLELECFVHGALCYCVSGRCYWSSYMGGKSGLRGRCVQPCRRKYTRDTRRQKEGERLFACQDLELAPVIRSLLSVPHLASWKIEGRKKGPHYVFHTVTAYRILRDEGENAQQRKLAQEILAVALGRPGVRARFLPQKKYQPMGGQTSSGLFVGKVNILQNGAPVLKPHHDLLPRDFLRIGVEDEQWHSTVNVNRPVPKGGALNLNLPRHKTPRAGTPVFLIDRREPELLNILKNWRTKYQARMPLPVDDIPESPRLPARAVPVKMPDMLVSNHLQKGRDACRENMARNVRRGLWLNAVTAEISPTMYKRVVFWLPPVIWPDNEMKVAKMTQNLWRSGARNFVCNAPGQRGYFPDQLSDDACLMAGPFCNVANSLYLEDLASLGFTACIVSPELPGADVLALPTVSPLPLGVIIGGFWPVGISRFGLLGINAGEAFTSPHGEKFWSRDRNGLTWIFPSWPLDLREKRQALATAGYSFFVFMDEHPPKDLAQEKRPGLFNWDGKLL